MQHLKTSDLGLALHIMTFCLWSLVKYDLVSTQSVLFWKLTRCFNVVSVSDFPFRSICSVLKCFVVLWHPAKTDSLCFYCRTSESPELRWSRNTAQPQPMEAHALMRVEAYQLHCSGGAETNCRCSWWTLRVKEETAHIPLPVFFPAHVLFCLLSLSL